MWKSLQEFRNSKEWRTFRLQLIMDRLNERNETICEYCGKPIVRKYDCIGHHKIELTSNNYHDLNLSLNPDNVMLVHHECHNIIHNRFGFTEKKVYLVIGSACSGKSSYIKSIAGRNDIILDVDRIWEAVSNNNIYDKPNSIKDIVLSIRETMLEQIAMRNFGGNAYVLSTESRALPRERLKQKINADEIIYIQATRDECLERLYNDPSREPYIKEHTEYINKFFDTLNEEGLPTY